MTNGLKRMFFMKEKKTLILKEKNSIFYENIVKNVIVFNGYPCKNVTKYFSYFSISENSASFSFFQKKTPIFVTARGFAPPPHLRTGP